MSMIVNAVTMGLIVFRIFQVLQEVKCIPDERSSGASGGSALRPVIFVMIESGMLLFSAQLVRAIVGSVSVSTNTGYAYTLIVSIHEMLNVITRSDISTFYFADNMD